MARWRLLSLTPAVLIGLGAFGLAALSHSTSVAAAWGLGVGIAVYVLLALSIGILHGIADVRRTDPKDQLDAEERH